MKLQLLVPHYKESAEVVKPLLDSIAIQQNVDFSDIGVIICNDGAEAVVLDRNWLDSYPFLIEYYTIPHGGLSTARNYCMDRAVADYVMFCDSDDMFFHSYGISWVIAEMNEPFDAMISCFVEETRTKDRKMVAFVEHECDPVFVHGKCYRLEFLRENGLRFPDGLNINEDSCFNILALTLSPRTKHMAKPFYMWKWRDDSTVRQHDDFTQRFFLQIVDSNAILLDGLISRDREADASLAFGTFVIRTYPDMHEEWDAERYAVAMKRLTEHLVGYGYLWDMLTDENKAEIIVATESKASIDDIQKWADEIRGR